MSLARTDGGQDKGTRERLLRQYEMAERLAQFGHWHWRLGSNLVDWSPETYRIHAVDPDTFEVSLEAAINCYIPKDRDRVEHALEAAMEACRGFDIQAAIQRPDGSIRQVRSVGETEMHDGELVGLFGIVIDITDAHKTEQTMQAAIQRMDDFIAVSSDWLWETDPDLRFTHMSQQVELITGVPANFYIGKTRRELVSKANRSPEMEAHLKLLDQRLPFRNFRYWSTSHDGRLLYVSTSGKPYYDADGNFAGYRGSARDLSREREIQDALIERNQQLTAATRANTEVVNRLEETNKLARERYEALREAQAEIRHFAQHDPLTGLANRRSLDERMDAYAAGALPPGRALAALHVDLDRFKQINDTMGHAAGDAILSRVTDFLRDAAGDKDLVARVGGDEFVILTECDGQRDKLEAKALRIIEALAKPIAHDGRDCHVGASIGIAMTRDPDRDRETLLVNADIALYRAKRNGRGCFEFFSESVQIEIARNRRIADGIVSGLERGELVAFYQPQFCARTLAWTGLEALARWRHPSQGLLTPDKFLPVAEDLSLVQEIDRHILQHSLADIRTLADLGFDAPKLSVNVSASRLIERDLIDGLQKMDLPPDQVSFELLESVFLDDVSDRVNWTIDALREMGIAIELDDFGSGHASIISLLRIRPDAVKIDRELIAPIADDNVRANLVRAIIDVAHTLEAQVIAEGIETLDQAERLDSLNCDALQGFYFSEPVPAEDLPDLLSAWETKRAMLRPKPGANLRRSVG